MWLNPRAARRKNHGSEFALAALGFNPKAAENHGQGRALGFSMPANIFNKPSIQVRMQLVLL